MVENEPAARLFGQKYIARSPDPFGLNRNAGKPHTGGQCACIHNPAPAKAAIVRARENDGVPAGGISHGALHQAGIAKGFVAIGEEDGASLRHQADLGHMLALQGAGQRTGRIDARCLCP